MKVICPLCGEPHFDLPQMGAYKTYTVECPCTPPTPKKPWWLFWVRKADWNEANECATNVVYYFWTGDKWVVSSVIIPAAAYLMAQGAAKKLIGGEAEFV